MAAKTKAKPAAKKKPVKKAPAKKAAVKKSAPPVRAKKIARASVVRAKPARRSPDGCDPAKVAEELGLADMAGRAPQMRDQEPFRIVSMVVDNGHIFGLANDQRVYRWNPRSALWVLHKEGLQP